MTMSGIILLKNYFSTDQVYLPNGKYTAQSQKKVVRSIIFKK